MKCVRIILTQTSANYKKEETDINKMTYPLPPYSTVIGALHNACGYTNIHHMNVSIQGNFESMGREIYTDHCFMGAVEDNRYTLVKLDNMDIWSKSINKVAVSLKRTCSFKDRKNIKVINEDLLREYIELKNDKKIKMPNTNFRLLNKSIKYYEVLYGIKLIIHISSDEETMQDILDNIYNLKSIGRSEDFVDVVEAEMVELYDEIDEDEVFSPYSAYLNLSAVRDDCIFTKTKDESHSVSGTKYLLNKIYEIVDGKRIFKDKKRVLYASEYFIEECNEDYGIYYDGEYIVSFM